MILSAEALGDALIVHIGEERIDAAIAIRFKDRMREVTIQPAPRVILDMSRVTFLDSSGLGALVAVMKFLAPARRLELASLRPNVQKVLNLTRMDTVFRIYPDISSAVSEGLRNAG
ncbi:STAS domain-containing protein [Paenirhodobacter sp.]|jgi:anti-sigma B factor antagonist|uniref:STAS domain-containing protein n=1 Tax=Paenirhodobacter sp. TaxID=1965326 RepID=UPI003B50EA7B